MLLRRIAMSLVIEIPDELAQQLQQRAAETGTAPEKVAISAIERQFRSEESLKQTLEPIRQAFRESGMTEEEAVELFEAEKHAMRRERRAKCQ
jgi:predicted transcriptional regulator